DVTCSATEREFYLPGVAAGARSRQERSRRPTPGPFRRNFASMRTMILCAGFGQRSRPLTDELPKPLLPVGDRPLLAHIARQLRAKGRTEAVANTHWLPDK